VADDFLGVDEEENAAFIVHILENRHIVHRQARLPGGEDAGNSLQDVACDVIKGI